MAEFPALHLWTDAYLADTTHLTTLENGAYLLLLMAAWRSPGCRLPNDDKLLARYARLTIGQWRRIKPTIMAFWTVESDHIHQGRLTDEYNAVRQLSTRQSDKAKARWLKNKDSANATASPGICPSDASPYPSLTLTPTLTQKGKKEKESPNGDSCAKRTLRDPYAQPSGFNEWWEECPRKRSKGDAHKAYVKIIKDGSTTEAELLFGMRAAKAYWQANGTEDQHIPYPGTWLRARGWEDDTTVRRKPTENEQLQEWVNGTQGHDSERDTIDGEYVEVSGDGPSGNGGSLPLGPVGSERQGSGRLGEPLAGELGESEPTQAGGHSQGRERVQAIAQAAAAGCSTRKKP